MVHPDGGYTVKNTEHCNMEQLSQMLSVALHTDGIEAADMETNRQTELLKTPDEDDKRERVVKFIMTERS